MARAEESARWKEKTPILKSFEEQIKEKKTRELKGVEYFNCFEDGIVDKILIIVSQSRLAGNALKDRTSIFHQDGRILVSSSL